MKRHELKLKITAAALLAAVALSACSGGEKSEKAEEDKSPELTEITVGASPAPHGEILEAAKPLLEKEGYALKIVEYTDYVQPNIALEDGELDANYFQHLPYLRHLRRKGIFLGRAFGGSHCGCTQRHHQRGQSSPSS